MLEQPAHDAQHAHVVCVAGHTGHQAADTAHEQRHRHARLARLDDLLDDVDVCDGIGLEEHAAGLAGARLGDLSVCKHQDERLDLQRRHAQDVVVVGGVLERHVVEEPHGVAANALVAGDEGEVRVELGGLLVVVARAQLGDVLEALGGLARDAADLAVDLVVAEAVDDLAARLLKALRPLDVVALVKARAQLEQGRDLLAVFCGGDEGLSQVRLAGKAVERDLDRYDRWVEGSLAQQLDKGVHALVGVAEHDVALLELRDQRLGGVEAGRPLRREGFAEQAGGKLFGQPRAQTPGEAHVERHARGKYLALLELQALEQQLFHGLGLEGVLHLQAHGSQPAPLLEDALHELAVVGVFCLVDALVDVDVCVAGDADDVAVLHRVHREDLGQRHLDHVLEQDEAEALARQLHHALALARQGHQAQDHAGGAQVARLAALAALGSLDLGGLELVFSLVKAHGHIEGAVFQMREGMARVDDLRREEGHDVGLCVVLHKGALLGVEVLGAQVADALGGKLSAQLLVGPLIDRVELMAALVDGLELLGGRPAGLGVDDGLLHKREVRERAHAHHEELLEVAPKDAHEVQAVEQGHARVAALVEHPLVEVQPG